MFGRKRSELSHHYIYHYKDKVVGLCSFVVMTRQVAESPSCWVRKCNVWCQCADYIIIYALHYIAAVIRFFVLHVYDCTLYW